MKNRVRKSILTMVLSLAVVTSGVLCMQSKEAQATDETTTDSRVYVEVEKTSFETYITNHTAPTKDGYLFAGWVTKDGTVIDSANDGDIDENGSNITAKFIPAHLAGVACQVKSNTYDSEITSTELRVVSVIDGGAYKELGFNLYRRMLVNGAYKEQLICGYSKDTETNTNKAAISEKYSGLYQYASSTDENPVVKKPADLFGSDAAGFYFTTAKIGPIPSSVYDSCIFVIRPYWVTADGTYVEGLAEFDRVSDGKNGIANISVNLKEAEAIAAGKMSITYDSNSFTYVDADFGRVFEEMEINAATSGKVNCVGNVADIASNVAEEKRNDVFVNLRFQVINEELTMGESTFTISGTEFINIDENDATAKVLNVKY